MGDYDRCLDIGGTGRDKPCKRGWGGFHPGGVNFLVCDGSVRLLNREIRMELLASLATVAGEGAGPASVVLVRLCTTTVLSESGRQPRRTESLLPREPANNRRRLPRSSRWYRFERRLHQRGVAESTEPTAGLAGPMAWDWTGAGVGDRLRRAWDLRHGRRLCGYRVARIRRAAIAVVGSLP